MAVDLAREARAGRADRYGRRLRRSGLALLAVDGLLWVLFVGYFMNRSAANITALLLVCAVVFGGFAVLGWRFPFVVGVLLIVPLAFPLGLIVAGLDLDDDTRTLDVAAALAWWVGAPLLIGLVFLAAGVVAFRTRRADGSRPA